MIALIVLVVILIVFFGLQYFNVHVLTNNQWHFLLVSTALAFFLLIALKSIFMGQVEGANSATGMLRAFVSDPYLMPVLFYVIWFLFSASIANAISGKSSDLVGFGDQPSVWVSQQDRLVL